VPGSFASGPAFLSEAIFMVEGWLCLVESGVDLNNRWITPPSFHSSGGIPRRRLLGGDKWGHLSPKGPQVNPRYPQGSTRFPQETPSTYPQV
jgi:hypothetical protein